MLHALQERRQPLGVTSAGTTGEQTSAAGGFRVQVDLRGTSTSAWRGDSSGDRTSVHDALPRALRPEHFIRGQRDRLLHELQGILCGSQLQG